MNTFPYLICSHSEVLSLSKMGKKEKARNFSHALADHACCQVVAVQNIKMSALGHTRISSSKRARLLHQYEKTYLPP